MTVAITGGIGSGKSYVCRLLSEQDIEVYDCDAAAKRLICTSEVLMAQLRQLVGTKLYINNVLNKQLLTHFLMESEAHARAVNSIVHPAVAEDFIASGATWMECAILYESGFDRLADCVVCVSAPLEKRIERVMLRDGISRADVLQWMNRQLPQEEVVKRADYNIVNDGQEDVRKQLNHLLKIIKI